MSYEPFAFSCIIPLFDFWYTYLRIDLGTVFSYLADTPEVNITLRIVLSIVGGGGIVAVLNSSCQTVR